MRRNFLAWLLLCICSAPVAAQEREVNLKIIQTSDVHGCYFPYDFINRRETGGSLARIHAFVEKERRQYGDNLLLFDNGDFLQGQPTAYYYNYIDTTSRHLSAEVLNFMGYNAGNMGNHDVETGNEVFDRWIGDCQFPILGANIIDTGTGKPHCKPYEVFVRDGVKVAVLGMITPAIPIWLSENLWKGLRFDDMEQTARHWIPIIQQEERPDIIIGLFHSGQKAEWVGNGKYREQASVEVAERVPGFDIVLFGHDHRRECRKVVNVSGDSVLVINPANRAFYVSDINVACKLKDGKVVAKHVDGKLTSVSKTEVSQAFMQHFAQQYEAVNSFVNKKIGRLTKTISTRPAYFGSSNFIDLIHQLQLELTGADISLTAPLSYDAEIKKGDIYVSDMFNLYKFENMLYTMRLTGEEVRKELEMSYGMWSNQMASADDHVVLIEEAKGDGRKYQFKNFTYNFDSAAGIIYTVDVSKPVGQRVNVVSMADGTPFDPARTYTVAINSYRGNGGGLLLTDGSGIPQAELKGRIVSSTDRDLRYYLMKYFEEHGTVRPKNLKQWKFVPQKWTKPASRRDYQLLFGEK